MLAVPGCADSPRLPKLTIVVRALKTMARDVLERRSAPAVSKAPSRTRRTTCTPLSTPIPSSSGRAMMFAKL